MSLPVLIGEVIWDTVKEILIQIVTIDGSSLSLWTLLGQLASVTTTIRRKDKEYVQESSPFDGLRMHYDSLNNEEQTWFTLTMINVAQLALELENCLIQKKVEVMPKGKKCTQFVDKRTISCLLAHSFLCIIPTTNDFRSRTYFPEANMTHLFGSLNSNVKSKQKLRCILHYFQRSSDIDKTNASRQIVTFDRMLMEAHKNLCWKNLKTSDRLLCRSRVDLVSHIEDTHVKYASIDFARQFLDCEMSSRSTSCIQEEILFSVCPELIAGMIFMETMSHNEVIVISGFERYCTHEDFFKYSGNYNDLSPTQNILIVVDAICYELNSMKQYTNEDMLHEINKVFVGFRAARRCFTENLTLLSTSEYRRLTGRNKSIRFSVNDDSTYDYLKSRDSTLTSSFKSATKLVLYRSLNKSNKKRTSENDTNLPLIASGNWGCGIFCGNAQIKTIIQWIAASMAGWDQMIYCTLGQHDLNELGNIVQKIVDNAVTVGYLTQKLQQFCRQKRANTVAKSLFEYLLQDAFISFNFLSNIDYAQSDNSRNFQITSADELNNTSNIPESFQSSLLSTDSLSNNLLTDSSRESVSLHGNRTHYLRRPLPKRPVLSISAEFNGDFATLENTSVRLL